MTQQRWIYQRSAITRIIDGDTIVVAIDVGFRTTVAKTLRLYGINTPEPRGASRPEGLKATQHLKDLLHGNQIVVETLADKTGKYGRYLAIIYNPDTTDFQWDFSINYTMLADGYAKRTDF